MFRVSGLSVALNHLTRRKNAQGAIDYSFSVSLVHQDLGIDEAASENKLFPLWASTQKNKSEVGENIQLVPESEGLRHRSEGSFILFFCWRQISGFGSFIAFEVGAVCV